MKRTIEFSRIPGSRKLFLDFLSGNTADYYDHYFASDDALQSVQRRLIQRTFPREEIVAVLLRQNKAYGAGEKTIANIEKLLEPNTTAVFTGQQVIVFGGPLFTFYKASLAVKLADGNCRKLQAPVVPIFWLASDDADFDEVASITLPGKNEQLLQLKYVPDRRIEGEPMASLVLDGGILKLLDEYEEALPDSEFRAELMATLREFYRPGQSIVTAFAKYMTYLFRDHGLILVDPSDEELRRLSVPIFRKELELREEGAKLVEQSNVRLQQQGYHLQVAKPGSYANLFHCDGRRAKIEFAKDGFEIAGSYYPQAKVEAMVEENPSLFSPNVFLRPVVQSHIFPTLIYFAGPAEAAYFAQIREYFHLFGEVSPIIYPRFSATIIERSVSRLMEKYGLTFEDFSGETGHLAADVIGRTFASDLPEHFHQLKEDVAARLANITRSLDQSDHGLVTNANRIAGRIEVEIRNLEEKVFQAHRKKNETLRRQLERAAFHLFPERRMQERVFPLNYYIAKYGFWIADNLYDAVDCNSSVHHLIYLDHPEEDV